MNVTCVYGSFVYSETLPLLSFESFWHKISHDLKSIRKVTLISSVTVLQRQTASVKTVFGNCPWNIRVRLVYKRRRYIDYTSHCQQLIEDVDRLAFFFCIFRSHITFGLMNPSQMQMQSHLNVVDRSLYNPETRVPMNHGVLDRRLVSLLIGSSCSARQKDMIVTIGICLRRIRQLCWC